jgi:hydrogenase nickel incorporation protein HypA/HybF
VGCAMHELGIVTEIVALAEERAEGAKVCRLTLEIGKLSTVLPDAVRFCFDVATEGTLLEGATLEIREVAGVGRCRACAASLALEGVVTRCGCGAFDVEWISGTEVRVIEMEVF